MTIFFTGLSGAGKSTLAKMLYDSLVENDTRAVTLMDGDVVRRESSSDLGFSRSDRDLNVCRIGLAASQITKEGGVAICALIAPYATARKSVRHMIEKHGRFIEVYVATPIAICEGRDPKGLYAKAREGKIKAFTGVSDPYEPPEKPELYLSTQDITPTNAVQEILLYLHSQGLVEAINLETADAYLKCFRGVDNA